jgi:hypothetical protein
MVMGKQNGGKADDSTVYLPVGIQISEHRYGQLFISLSMGSCLRGNDMLALSAGT